MNFSPYQWVAIIILDVSIRLGVLFGLSLNILFIPVALCFSLLHLTVLILVNYSVTPFE